MAVGIFDAAEKDLRDKNWIFGVHNAVEEALRTGGGDEIGVLGELLAERLKALRSAPYAKEVGVFIDMLGGSPAPAT